MVAVALLLPTQQSNAAKFAGFFHSTLSQETGAPPPVPLGKEKRPPGAVGKGRAPNQRVGHPRSARRAKAKPGRMARMAPGLSGNPVRHSPRVGFRSILRRVLRSARLGRPAENQLPREGRSGPNEDEGNWGPSPAAVPPVETLFAKDGKPNSCPRQPDAPEILERGRGQHFSSSGRQLVAVHEATESPRAECTPAAAAGAWHAARGTRWP
jgi:hypothetical protein